MSEQTSPPPGDAPPGEPGPGWASLFQQSTDPIFILNRRRRLRFVNRAWEALTGRDAESALGLFCLPRTDAGDAAMKSLARTLSPPPEVIAGRTQTTRRPVPPAKVGPPWWDLHFMPMLDVRGTFCIIGRITPVGEKPAVATRGPTAFNERTIALRQTVAAHYCFALLDSAVPEMERVAAQARAAAATRAPVWIVGEPGTGKETLARVIHFEGVTREQTFICLDCEALQPYLLRGMLFGQPGLADSARLGTIYLKSPESAPLEVQEELLDWHARQTTLPRLVVGTMRPPAEVWKQGRIAQSMLATLAVLEIRLPPLRERRTDLPRLVEVLGAGSNATPTAAARALLQTYSWPGNLRELRSALAEAARQSGGGVIDIAHFPLAIRERAALTQPLAVRPGTVGGPALLLEPILEEVERRTIRLALHKAKGNKSEAADILGITRTQLWRRLKDLKLETE